MLRPRPYITIASDTATTQFKFVHRFEISKSYEQLTDTAHVILPRKVTQAGQNLFAGPSALFKRGDRITIEAGYYPNRETLFEGFIKYVSTNIPVQLECEDYMFLFKQFTITYPKTVQVRKLSKKGKPLKHPKIVSENITLKQLMDWIFEEGNFNDLLDEVTYEIVDNIKLGQFRATNATPAQVFEKLKDNYGLNTYMIGKKLYVGFANNAARTKTRSFKLEEVGINTNELDYQRAEDVRIKVKCIGMMPDNTKVEAEAGDDDGETRTYHFYNVSDQMMLQKMALERVNANKYTGYRGTFETFGEPNLTHGDIAELTSKIFPEKDGSYLVKAVKYVLGVEDGYRQFLELGNKVA